MLGSIFSWETLNYVMLILYIPACVGLIAVVLLQKGKGVGFAGAFGVGPGSDAVFGPRGARTLPQKLTYIMAATFMVLALCMSLIAGHLGKGAAPGKVNEQPASQTDMSGLDDLGSAIKEEAPASSSATATAPVSSSATVPAAPAASEPPAKESTEAPAPETPSAPETPAAPAPSGS
jgi:preprotein translocase subunit SecG